MKHHWTEVIACPRPLLPPSVVQRKKRETANRYFRPLSLMWGCVLRWETGRRHQTASPICLQIYTILNMVQTLCNILIGLCNQKSFWLEANIQLTSLGSCDFGRLPAGWLVGWVSASELESAASGGAWCGLKPQAASQCSALCTTYHLPVLLPPSLVATGFQRTTPRHIDKRRLKPHSASSASNFESQTYVWEKQLTNSCLKMMKFLSC